MNDALVGFSGFVGSTLMRQRSFDHLYRSTNIAEIRGKSFGLVVCAAAPAKKWLANLEPEADLAVIESLCDHLSTIHCKTFVLISTVDVFADPINVDETSDVSLEGLHAYGRNRRSLELYVLRRFESPIIVRLPGLVGPGLRKNAIFDFQHRNNVDGVDSRAVYQFYPMVNLWFDIARILDLGVSLVHLTAEPVSVQQIAYDAFGIMFRNELPQPPALYDFRSRFSEQLGGRGSYTYDRRETIAAVRAYAQSEPQASLEQSA